jgi:PhnB protein
MPASSLTPMLTVRDAAAAITFYERAFGAVERQRFATPNGQLVAEMSVDSERFYVVDENPAAFNFSPTALGGTSVRMNLVVADADSTTERALAAGAVEVFPVMDQPYGLRQGRVQDPYGHHWLIGAPLIEQ